MLSPVTRREGLAEFSLLVVRVELAAEAPEEDCSRSRSDGDERSVHGPFEVPGVVGIEVGHVAHLVLDERPADGRDHDERQEHGHHDEEQSDRDAELFREGGIFRNDSGHGDLPTTGWPYHG